MDQGPDRVRWCLQALGDDRERRGGVLEDADVHRLVSQLALDPNETRLVWLEVSKLDLVTHKSEPLSNAASAGNGSAATDAVDDLLGDIGLLPLLSASEEIRLAREWRSARQVMEEADCSGGPWELKAVVERGKTARERLICSNMKLVLWVAREYTRVTDLERDDLVQMGICGLIHAADKYDPERGYRFSTYASISIRRAILRELSTGGRTIRLPPHIIKQLARLSKCRRSSRARLGRSPTVRELAAETGFTQAQVHFLMAVKSDAVSYDAPPGEADDRRDGGPPARPDSTPDPSIALEKQEERRILRQTITALDGRSQSIVRHRLSLDGETFMTLKELGTMLGLTRERVRQLELKALNTLTLECRRLSGEMDPATDTPEEHHDAE